MLRQSSTMYLKKNHKKAQPKPDKIFPHTLLHSLTLQFYKLIQVIHVGHSCSDKPFSSPWEQFRTVQVNVNKWQTEARFKPAQRMSASINPFITTSFPSKSTYLIFSTIIFTAPTRGQIPLESLNFILPCVVLKSVYFQDTQFQEENVLKWNERNEINMLAFSGQRGKYVKHFISIHENFVVFLKF